MPVKPPAVSLGSIQNSPPSSLRLYVFTFVDFVDGELSVPGRKIFFSFFTPLNLTLEIFCPTHFSQKTSPSADFGWSRYFIVMKKNLSHEEIIEIIAAAQLSAVAASGNCFTVALALKKTILKDGALTVAANVQILKEKNRYIGHAAVRHAGAFYDGEGWKDWDQFMSWGSLDPEDGEWAELAGLSLKRWSLLAHRAKIYEVDEEELLSGYVKEDLLQQFESSLLEARAKLGL